jgi:hypothetical protein
MSCGRPTWLDFNRNRPDQEPGFARPSEARQPGIAQGEHRRRQSEGFLQAAFLARRGKREIAGTKYEGSRKRAFNPPGAGRHKRLLMRRGLTEFRPGGVIGT